MPKDSREEFDDEQYLLQGFVRDASCFDLLTMQNALPVDLVLNGRYRVLAPLSSGGMADVYVVIDQSYRSPPKRALKITKAPSSELESRFRNEYESQVQLRHDNIVPIYDIGNYRGRSWMVLDLVHGVSWDALQGQPLPPNETIPNTPALLTLEQLLKYLELSHSRISDSLAAELIEVCADAISTIHATGFVHRDLKPANIFLDIRTTGGINRLFPRIGDFGLVKRFASHETSVAARELQTDATHPRSSARLQIRRRSAFSRKSLDRRFVKTLSSSNRFETFRKRKGTPPAQRMRRHGAPTVGPKVRDIPRQRMTESDSWRPAHNQAEQETARTILTTADKETNTWNIPPGTRRYMSPERWAGITHPSNDVWALGVVLYQMLTGDFPYKVIDEDIRHAGEVHKLAIQAGQPATEADARAAREIAKQFNSEAVKPHLLFKSKQRGPTDRDLSEICCRCISPKPVDRYQSANELCADLRRYLTHRTVTAYRAPISHRIALWRRRRPTLSTALLLMTVAVAVLVAGAVKYFSDGEAYKARLKEKAREALFTSIDMLMQEGRSLMNQRMAPLAMARFVEAASLTSDNSSLLGEPAEDQLWNSRMHAFGALQSVPFTCRSIKPEQPLVAMRIAPNGKYVLTASSSSIVAWRIDGADEPLILPLASQPTSAWFHPTSNQIIGATAGRLHLWNLETRDSQAIPCDFSTVTGYFPKPDADEVFLLGYSTNNTLLCGVLDTATATYAKADVELGTDNLLQGGFALAAENRGRFLAVPFNRTVRFLNWDDRVPVPAGITKLDTEIRCVAVAPDRRTFIACLQDGSLAKYPIEDSPDMVSTPLWKKWTLVGTPHTIEFSEDGTTVKLSTTTGFEFLDTEGNPRNLPWQTTQNVLFDTFVRNQLQSTDGRFQIALGNNGVLRVNDMAGIREDIDTLRFRSDVEGLCISDDGSLVFAWDRKGWPAVSLIDSRRTFYPDTRVQAACMIGLSNRLAIINLDRSITTVEVPSDGDDVRRSEVRWRREDLSPTNLISDNAGATLAVTSKQGTAFLLSTTLQDDPEPLVIAADKVYSDIQLIGFSPDGSRLAIAADQDGQSLAALIDSATGTVISTTSDPARRGIGFFPTTGHFWVCQNDGTFHVLDSVSGVQIHKYSLPNKPQLISPARKNSLIAVASFSVDAALPMPIVILEGETGEIQLGPVSAGTVLDEIALSDFGRSLAVVGSNQILRVVSATTGADWRAPLLEGTTASHCRWMDHNNITALVFKVREDQSLRIWTPLHGTELDLDDQLSIAEQITPTGKFTETETESEHSWSKYVTAFKPTAAQESRYYYQSATAAERIGDRRRSADIWAECLLRTQVSTGRTLSTIHARRAMLLSNTDITTGRRAAHDAIRADPTDPLALVWAGYYSGLEQDYASQRASLQQAFERMSTEAESPGMSLGWVSATLAYSNAALGDVGAAATEYERSMGLAFGNAMHRSQAALEYCICLSELDRKVELNSLRAKLLDEVVPTSDADRAILIARALLLTCGDLPDLDVERQATTMLNLFEARYSRDYLERSTALYRLAIAICGSDQIEGVRPSLQPGDDTSKRTAFELAVNAVVAARRLEIDFAESLLASADKLLALSSEEPRYWVQRLETKSWIRRARAAVVAARSSTSAKIAANKSRLDEEIASLGGPDLTADQLARRCWLLIRRSALDSSKEDLDLLDESSERLVRLDEDRADAWFLRCYALRATGDRAAAATKCCEMWQRFKDTSSAHMACMSTSALCGSPELIPLKAIEDVLLPSMMQKVGSDHGVILAVMTFMRKNPQSKDQRLVDSVDKLLQNRKAGDDLLAKGIRLWAHARAGHGLEISERFQKWETEVADQLATRDLPGHVVSQLAVLRQEIRAESK